MALFTIIFFSGIIGFLLLMLTGPLIGGIIISSILIGCIIRGLYLLTKIYQAIVPREDRVNNALDHYLAEREKIEQRTKARRKLNINKR
ncbi:hypothetical protein [Solibacillus sp. CAU 1738]|uniref:hypothetical protein n=1 Tax=Solibacillus sp. CAU 1738 TaxID=3140363 RepID=UPI003261D119